MLNTNRGAIGPMLIVFGILGVSFGILLIISGGSDAEFSIYFLPPGAVVTLVGLVITYAMNRLDRKRAHNPKRLTGLVVSDGRSSWGQCMARFGNVSQDGAI